MAEISGKCIVESALVDEKNKDHPAKKSDVIYCSEERNEANGTEASTD